MTRAQLGKTTTTIAFAAAVFAAATAACGSRPASPVGGEGPATELGPPLPDADTELEGRTQAAVLSHRPQLRACYEDALAAHPTMEGRVVLVVDVGQNGRALHVLESSRPRREGLSDGVVKCLARVLRSVPFHDGAARPVRIRVPLAFSKDAR